LIDAVPLSVVSPRRSDPRYASAYSTGSGIQFIRGGTFFEVPAHLRTELGGATVEQIQATIFGHEFGHEVAPASFPRNDANNPALNRELTRNVWNNCFP
jgi:hypothetical protein